MRNRVNGFYCHTEFEPAELDELDDCGPMSEEAARSLLVLLAMIGVACATGLLMIGFGLGLLF